MMQSKKITIYTCVLAGLFLFVLIQKSHFFSSERVIELRESGFYPDQIQIEEGEEVRFVNKTNKPFWPASNPHPTHTTYQDFDSRQPIAPGESWIFKFKKGGIFLYHNHLYAIDKGAVIVGEHNATMNTSNFDICKNLPKGEKQTCFEFLLKNTLQNNPQEGLELFKKLVEIEPYDCHQYAHDFGEYVARDDPSGEKNKIGIESSYCAYGFWHGFTTQILKDYNLKTAERFCENIKEPDPTLQLKLKNNCYHGLGIGLIQDPPPVEFWGNAEAEPMITIALEKCDQVGKEWQSDCHSGVFHPIIEYMSSGQYSFSFNNEQPFAFCLKQKEHHRSVCYYQIAAKLAGHTNNNLEKSFELIQQIPTKFEREYTFTLAAINLVNPQMSDEEYVSFINKCKNFATPDSCLKSVLHSFFANGTVEKAHIRSFDMCSSKDLHENDRFSCFENSIKLLRQYYNEKKVKEICTPLEENYKGICIV